MMAMLKRTTHVAAKALLAVAAVGLVLMTVLILWQVFGRYVLRSTPSWTEQASLTLMIWFVSLASAAGVREGFHIRIVALEETMSPRGQQWMRVVSNGVVALCGAAMLVWGGELVMRTWSHVIPSLGISRGLAYLGLPIAGGLIVLFAIERILEELVAMKPDARERA